MRFYILLFVGLSILGIVSYTMYLEYSSIETNEIECQKHHWHSLYYHESPGRIYNNSKFCVDPKTRQVYSY